jgi:hypothetical protein
MDGKKDRVAGEERGKRKREEERKERGESKKARRHELESCLSSLHIHTLPVHFSSSGHTMR